MSVRGRSSSSLLSGGLLALALCAFVCAAGAVLAQDFAQPAASNLSDMAERMRACAPCHGAEGQGISHPYFRRLAGKPAGYLLNQLLAFRNGRRRYPPMNYLLEFQDEPYLKAMAAYFAAERPPAQPRPPPSVSQAVLAHGQDIVEHGEPDHEVPQCIACHNPRLTGMEPGIPGLDGLNSKYISAQLGA